MVPSTVQQVAIVLVLLLPGVFYQAVRDRLRGPRPAEEEAGNRIIRALAVSLLLDGCYLAVGGSWLVRVATGSGPGALSGLAEHPRQAAAVGLLLIAALPAAAAWAEARFAARRAPARYDPAATAWDALFRTRGSCFVRALLKNGSWVGGWYGPASAAGAYPQPADVYLQAQYAMRPDGTFAGRLPYTGGVYFTAADVDVVEIVEVPTATAGGGTDGLAGAAPPDGQPTVGARCGIHAEPERRPDP